MNTTDAHLVAETRQLIEEVESGNTAHAAWVAIQDRVRRLYEANRTQTEVGELIGKKKTWVGDLLAWDSGAPETPFARPERPSRDEQGVQKLARENPKAIAEAIKEKASPEARREIVEALLEPDPEREQKIETMQRKARKQGHAQKQRLAWVNIEDALGKAGRHVKDAILLARECDLDDEAREVLVEGVAELRDKLGLLDVAVAGGATIDWDAELAKLDAEAV